MFMILFVQKYFQQGLVHLSLTPSNFYLTLQFIAVYGKLATFIRLL